MRTSELCRGLWRKNTGCEDRVYGVGNGVIDRGPPKASRERDSKVGGKDAPGGLDVSGTGQEEGAGDQGRGVRGLTRPGELRRELHLLCNHGKPPRAFLLEWMDRI